MELGTVKPCLVTNWGGVYEATATWSESVYGRNFWFVRVPQLRGKNGKSEYVVSVVKYEEDGDFILL